MPQATVLQPTPLRAALLSLRQALVIGLGIGFLLWATGLSAILWQTLLVCLIFTGLIVTGFHVAQPWVAWKSGSERSPFRQALGSLVRILALYTVLLYLGAILIRFTLGLNLMARQSEALLTYFIGLTITSIVSGLHTTESLVEVERAQRRAELEALRLEADHARQGRELEEARQLQLSMLPSAPPAWGGLGSAYLLETATEVGGDTYDYRLLPDGSLLVAFGDATGHGLQAGLIVTAMKALFHTLPPGAPLPEAMNLLSQGIRGLNLPRMAMAVTLLHFQGDQVRLCNAGMPPVHHFGAAGAVTGHRASGPPLGQLKAFSYAEASLTLAQGDGLLLCSDGFPECLDPEDRMLGYAGLTGLIQRHARQAPGAALDGLAGAAHAWAKGRPLADDMSFLIFVSPSC